ncbi:hydrogenase maturation protease [Streptomyces sp. TRM70308]|uniref:hydrogenase maturation protease n=1 Tax=Streptomyces sp. TRM70308 TaxID=3131932 RepID=UPI003D01446E
MSTPWETPGTASDPARTVLVDGVAVGRGSRVRLRPVRGADIIDLALTGRTAEVVGVEEDLEGNVHLAVILDGDPGRDFAAAAQIGHRFFFSPEEVEPAPHGAGGAAARAPRVLVAGIGNIFLGDDGFGPAVATALREVALPAEAHVADFGIRGMDLAYRLTEGYAAVLFVDAAPRGQRPGTLSVIEPPVDDFDDVAPEAHAMDPVKVLALARRLGEGPLPRVLVVGCEPLVRMTGEEPDVSVGLSEPVRQAVTDAVPLITSLVTELLAEFASPPRAEPGEEVSPR